MNNQIQFDRGSPGVPTGVPTGGVPKEMKLVQVEKRKAY